MKTSNPKSRNHLAIGKTDRVLEVGCGHNPHFRSNVIVDKFIDSNFHRSGDIKVLRDQVFLCADGEDLPFKDNEFDYAICNQVLEHVENPIQFIKEQSRVSKKGYIEVPSLMGEYLFPKKSHKWLILEIDGKLILMDKKEVNFQSSLDLGELFLHYLPSQSLGYKIMQYTHGDVETIRYEWEGEIEILVNPTDDKYRQYFEKPWTIQDAATFFPKKSTTLELWDTLKAIGYILTRSIKAKLGFRAVA